jgi:hypothetical protein
MQFLVKRLTLLAFGILIVRLLSLDGLAHAGPVNPHYVRFIGSPERLAAYWHDQRWESQDSYACALYAQASVLHALGYDFAEELRAARELGLRDGWYSPTTGAIGLGQPLRARGVRFEAFGTSVGGTITRRDALYRLRRALAVGQYAIVNLNAARLSYYRDSGVIWHTIWVTGLAMDANGEITTVIANDSLRGAAVEYPVNEFLDAWGHESLNYYAIFVSPRRP